MLLVMYDKNHLDISIFAQKENLKEEVMQHMQGLKKALNSVGITPGIVKLMDLKESEQKSEEEESFENIYEHQIGLGINIKV